MKGALVHLAVEGGAVAALILAATLLPGSAPPKPPAQHFRLPPPPPPQTKDRVPDDQLEALVEQPMAFVAQGQRAEADRTFRALLADARARGDKVRAADLLSAYGVALYRAGDAEAPGDTRRAAIPWLREAVAATREAWGDRHAETALALHDYADVLRKIDPEAPPAEAEQAFREALAIRRETLGPANGETLITMGALADVLSVHAADPAHFAEAKTLYETIISAIPKAALINPMEETLNARIGLASLYARTRHAAEALAEFTTAREQFRRHKGADDAVGACFTLASGRERLMTLFGRSGDAEAARKVGAQLPADTGMRCLTGTF